tara:strand:- start:46 stop:210 length:165 start_codon:yes stop_codon:yes gene_type:complete
LEFVFDVHVKWASPIALAFCAKYDASNFSDSSAQFMKYKRKKMHLAFAHKPAQS